MRQFMCRVYLIASIISFLFIFAGCGFATLDIKSPDGTETTASGFRLGTDSAVKDLTIQVNKDGSRSMSLGSADSNQTNGMAQANALIGTVVESAVKGAVKP